MSFIARAATAVALLLGIYVLALGMVGVLAFAVYEGIVHGFGGFLLGKGLFLIVFLVLALGRAFWAVRKLSFDDSAGLLLSPEDQPRLWAEVRAIAQTVGTRAPDEIRLAPVVNASVTEESRLLGLIGGRRVLTVGVPLLMGLTSQQLRSVLAHELGHFSHRHTALAPIAYRGQVTLGHVVGRLGQESLTGLVFRAYGRLYLRVTRSVSRRQELEADGWSHRVAGKAASAQAMRELPALDALWMHFLDEYAFRIEGVRPDDLLGGFANLLASPQRRREMTAIQRDLPDGPTDPYDTHPSLAARVAFFESLPDDGISDDETSAVAFLEEPEALLRELEIEMFAPLPLEPRAWSWIAETAGVRRAREYAAVLVRATREVGMGAADLRQALVALGRGDARRLVGPYIAPEASDEEVDSAARILVVSAVSAALVEHCGARFVLDWDATDALVDPEGHAIDVAGLVESTTDRESADLVIRALAEEGVPMSFAVDPAEVDAADGAGTQALEPVMHAVAAGVHWCRTQIVVVADNALIIKRMGVIYWIAAAFRHSMSDGYRPAMLRVASTPLPRLLEDRRAEVFSWDQVGPTTLRGTRLALTLDGKPRRIRVKKHAIAGDLLGSLRQQLGERLAPASVG
ncbi:MAG TPA: M48 family metalloprotease [Nocardioides sp.]|nr:M48 family metalloprotease [Nocardioides sp.]